LNNRYHPHVPPGAMIPPVNGSVDTQGGTHYKAQLSKIRILSPRKLPRHQLQNYIAKQPQYYLTPKIVIDYKIPPPTGTARHIASRRASGRACPPPQNNNSMSLRTWSCAANTRKLPRPHYIHQTQKMLLNACYHASLTKEADTTRSICPLPRLRRTNGSSGTSYRPDKRGHPPEREQHGTTRQPSGM
jgi:hypothetical protein